VDLVEGGGLLRPGLYLLDLEASGVEYDRWDHRKLLVVSKHNVTIKTSSDEVWAWVSSLATGQPTGGLTLTALDAEGDALGTATTGADGLARFALDGVSRGSLTVVADEPFILTGTGWDWSAGIGPWEFGLEEQYGVRDHRAHIYTDRPIYRPDQTVYFRGVLRAEEDVQYSLSRQDWVWVRVYGPTGEELYNEQLQLDEYGAFHGQVLVGEGASLGQYAIQVEFAGEYFGADFTVAAYRPPEFEVIVTPERAELAAGQATEAAVDVRYFFGGPVADASVEWNVLSAPYRFEPTQFGRYDFTDEDDPWVCRWCWWW